MYMVVIPELEAVLCRLLSETVELFRVVSPVVEGKRLRTMGSWRRRCAMAGARADYVLCSKLCIVRGHFIKARRQVGETVVRAYATQASLVERGANVFGALLR